MRALANRIAIAELPLRERFVDHRCRGRVNRVARVEVASAAQGNPNRLEVAGRDAVAKGALILVRIDGHRLPLDAVPHEIAAQRKLTRERRGFNARYLPRGLGRSVEELVHGAQVVVELPTGDLHLHREHVRRIEPGRDGEEPLQAPQQQTGADEQNEGERDLGDDQSTARELMAAGRAARRVLNAAARITARCLQRGHQANGDSDERREGDGKRERRPVDGDRVRARKSRRRERHEGCDTGSRHRHADHAAERGQQQAFREQLPDDPQSPGPERGPHRELAASLSAAREQQIRHVHARNREQQ